MTAEPAEWKPRLRRSMVLRRDGLSRGDLLLMPERVVVLNVQAAAIVRSCDGSRTVDEIVDELRRRFPGASPDHDVLEFIARIKGEGWLR